MKTDQSVPSVLALALTVGLVSPLAAQQAVPPPPGPYQPAITAAPAVPQQSFTTRQNLPYWMRQPGENAARQPAKPRPPATYTANVPPAQPQAPQALMWYVPGFGWAPVGSYGYSGQQNTTANGQFTYGGGMNGQTQAQGQTQQQAQTGYQGQTVYSNRQGYSPQPAPTGPQGWAPAPWGGQGFYPAPGAAPYGYAQPYPMQPVYPWQGQVRQ